MRTRCVALIVSRLNSLCFASCAAVVPRLRVRSVTGRRDGAVEWVFCEARESPPLCPASAVVTPGRARRLHCFGESICFCRAHDTPTRSGSLCRRVSPQSQQIAPPTGTWAPRPFG